MLRQRQAALSTCKRVMQPRSHKNNRVAARKDDQRLQIRSTTLTGCMEETTHPKVPILNQEPPPPSPPPFLPLPSIDFHVSSPLRVIIPLFVHFCRTPCPFLSHAKHRCCPSGHERAGWGQAGRPGLRPVWYASQKLLMAPTHFAKIRLAPAGFLSQYGYGLGLCSLGPRGQTCWRLGLACVGAQRLDYRWRLGLVRWCPEARHAGGWGSRV